MVDYSWMDWWCFSYGSCFILSNESRSDCKRLSLYSWTETAVYGCPQNLWSRQFLLKPHNHSLKGDTFYKPLFRVITTVSSLHVKFPQCKYTGSTFQSSVFPSRSEKKGEQNENSSLQIYRKTSYKKSPTEGKAVGPMPFGGKLLVHFWPHCWGHLSRGFLGEYEGDGGWRHGDIWFRLW